MIFEAVLVLIAAPVLTEWTVPWEETRPRDPFVDAAGIVWFVGQRGNYIAALDPVTGQFRRLPLDDGTGPHNLIVQGTDTIYYAGNRAAHIGRMNARTGTTVKIPMPDARARDPHTLVFDADGDIWFTVQGGNFVGKLDVSTDEVRLLPVPTKSSRPYGIVLDRAGTVWATEFGTNKLIRVDPGTFELEEVVLPRKGARPRRIATTGDGIVWYVDYAEGYLGRLDPASGEITEWRAPSAERSFPYAMTVDAKDRLWFFETGVRPNLFVGFDPATERFTEPVPVASGGGSVRHMMYHAPTNTVWFGTDTNTIGRAELPN